MMAEVTSVKRIGVVFYVYRVNSIKNIEQVENRNATTALKLYQIFPTQKIQQWREFLKGPENKKEFIKFLTSECRKRNYCASLQHKEILLAWDEECWEVTSPGSTKIDSLSTTQEEADTIYDTIF